MLFVLPVVTRRLSNTEGKEEKWSSSKNPDANSPNPRDKI